MGTTMHASFLYFQFLLFSMKCLLNRVYNIASKAPLSNLVHESKHHNLLMHAYDVSKANFALPCCKTIDSTTMLLAMHHQVTMHLRSLERTKEASSWLHLKQLFCFFCTFQTSRASRSS